MSSKKALLFVLCLVLAFGISTVASAQSKKGGKAAKAAPAPAAKKAGATPSGENDNALDLNSASLEKLMTLNGVDLMTARKIAAARPFKKKDEIVSKKIMTQEDFNRIARSVTVKAPEQPAAKGKKG